MTRIWNPDKTPNADQDVVHQINLKFIYTYKPKFW